MTKIDYDVAFGIVRSAARQSAGVKLTSPAVRLKDVLSGSDQQRQFRIALAEHLQKRNVEISTRAIQLRKHQTFHDLAKFLAGLPGDPTTPEPDPDDGDFD